MTAGFGPARGTARHPVCSKRQTSPRRFSLFLLERPWATRPREGGGEVGFAVGRCSSFLHEDKSAVDPFACLEPHRLHRDEQPDVRSPQNRPGSARPVGIRPPAEGSPVRRPTRPITTAAGPLDLGHGSQFRSALGLFLVLIQMSRPTVAKGLTPVPTAPSVNPRRPASRAVRPMSAPAGNCSRRSRRCGLPTTGLTRDAQLSCLAVILGRHGLRRAAPPWQTPTGGGRYVRRDALLALVLPFPSFPTVKSSLLQNGLLSSRANVCLRPFVGLNVPPHALYGSRPPFVLLLVLCVIYTRRCISTRLSLSPPPWRLRPWPPPTSMSTSYVRERRGPTRTARLRGTGTKRHRRPRQLL